MNGPIKSPYIGHQRSSHTFYPKLIGMDANALPFDESHQYKMLNGYYLLDYPCISNT